MPLDPGARLGPYEITGRLGAGGMGEVYRARDTRLGREVAVKVLPTGRNADEETRERFVREARVISSLNHPNVCTVHDVGREGDADYLVLELLEGESLAERLQRGPLKLPEALRVGAEIAAALDVAHRAGVVHRDLKPGNVMLTRAGAKVLDFGIAKLVDEAAPASPPGFAPTALPTRTTPLTSQGAIVGTLSYMAPEQLEGKPVDARSDLFAFGAVLYEMLTGRRAFGGESQASVIAAILEREPAPPTTLDASLPRALDRLVRECLAKDPERRRHSAHDLALEIRGIGEAEPAAPARSSRSARIVAGAGVLAAVAFAALWLAKPPSSAARVVEIAVPVDLPQNPAAPSVAPDGSAVAFVDLLPGESVSRIYVRDLGGGLARPVAGSEHAVRPFFSADGAEIAFFEGGKLLAIPRAGGRTREICDASYGVGGAWSGKGTIVFSSAFNHGLARVDARGGTATPLTELDPSRGESAHVWPVLLADDEHFLFLSRTIAKETSRIEMGSLGGGPRRVVVEADALVGYADPWLVFARSGTMYAQRFDPSSGTVSGERRVVVDDVAFDEAWASVGASVRGDVLAFTPHVSRKVEGGWLDARGKTLGPVFEDEDVSSARLSPDGSKVALVRLDPRSGGDDVWVVDLDRGVKTRVTTTPGDEDLGSWTADGSAILFNSDTDGPYAIWSASADGSEAPRPLVLEPGHDWVSPAVDPRGRRFYATREGGGARSDLWRVDLDDPSRREPWLASDAAEGDAKPSPDGRFVAYHSSRSGRTEIYLRGEDGRGLEQVSSDGGTDARWEPDGRAIRYFGSDDRIHRVPLRAAEDRLLPGRWDPVDDLDGAGVIALEFAPDGRMLVVRDASRARRGFRVRVGWNRALGGN